MKTVDVLIKARNIIKRHGWTQGTMGNCERGFCAIGALSRAGAGDIPDRAERYLDAAIGMSTVRFNDTPGRLKGEVILAFDKAIKNAKRRHIWGD